MTDLNWATVRTTTINKFNGETPGPTIETAIIDIFELSPQTVLRTIEEVAQDVQTGAIARGWPILHYRLEQRTQPIRDVTIQRPDDRAKATARAEQWIKVAGLLFDRETELEDELFGDRGNLKDWNHDNALHQRILTLYANERPRGEQLERETDQAGQRHRAQRTCQDCGTTRPYPGRTCPTPACQHRRAEQIEADLKAELEQQAALPAELQA